MNDNFEEPNEFYKGIFQRLLEGSIPGKDIISEQLSAAKVKEIPDKNNYGSLELQVPDNIPNVEVEQRLVAEIVSADTDGVPIHALLFVDDGKVSVLDIYKADGTDIDTMPSPADFKEVSVS